MRRLGSLCAMLVLLMVALFSHFQFTSARIDGKPRGRDVVAQFHSQFGLDMYSLMASHDNTSNIFFSPMSIGTALSILYAGSGGSTGEQLAAVLHFRGKKSHLMRANRALLRWNERTFKKGVTVEMTNRIYAAYNLRIRTKFINFMERIYSAQVERLKFANTRRAAWRINENVKKDTHGNINNLIQPSMLSGNTRMVVVNALYFKGDWLMKFKPENTEPADFHTPNGVVQVPMMKAKKRFAVGELRSMNARILKLPYKGEKVEMMILLPNERDGLPALEEHLRNASLVDLSWFAQAERPVLVKMPKFSLEESVNLKPVLERMGLTDMFDASKADFSAISRTQELFVTDAVHKAKLIVNEEGTEASAATAVLLGFRMLSARQRPFIVDRPFVLAIRDVTTGSTLFMGRVIDPSA